MSYKSVLSRCVICNQAVNLIESKTDEYGQAVHEDCYVSMLVSKEVDTQAGFDHPSRLQTGQQKPFLARHSDELSRVIPLPHRAYGGFWY